MEKTLIYPFSFILGLLLGSFSNVCIYRIPKNESVVFPGSHCPKCKTLINIYDNIPLLSYLILMGRCRACGSRISPRYFIVELITGILFLAVFWRFNNLPEIFSYLLLVFSLVVVSVIDLDHKIIPDIISLPGILIGIFLGYFVLPIGLKGSLLGLFVGGGLLYLVAVASKGGMGGGDIKLIAMIGAFIGWKNVLLTIFLGAFLGSVAGIYLMAIKKRDRKDMIPFGPFLSIGSIISLFYGQSIIVWYFNGGFRDIIRDLF